eukprot:1620884-Rhodomonas_salina.1
MVYRCPAAVCVQSRTPRSPFRRDSDESVGFTGNQCRRGHDGVSSPLCVDATAWPVLTQSDVLPGAVRTLSGRLGVDDGEVRTVRQYRAMAMVDCRSAVHHCSGHVVLHGLETADQGDRALCVHKNQGIARFQASGAGGGAGDPVAAIQALLPGEL